MTQQRKRKQSINQVNGDTGLMLKRKGRMEKLWTWSCEDQTHRLQGGWGIKRVRRRECWGRGPTRIDPSGVGRRRVGQGWTIGVCVLSPSQSESITPTTVPTSHLPYLWPPCPLQELPHTYRKRHSTLPYPHCPSTAHCQCVFVSKLNEEAFVGPSRVQPLLVGKLGPGPKPQNPS